MYYITIRFIAHDIRLRLGLEEATGAGSKMPPHRVYESLRRCLGFASEQINALKICQDTAATYIKVRDSAVIESDRNQPRGDRRPKPRLLDG